MVKGRPDGSRAGLVGPASQWRWWGRGDARVRAGSAAAEGGARHIGSSRRPCAETDRPSPAAPAPRASSVAALGDFRPLTVPLAQAVGPEEGDRVWFMSAPRGLRGGGGVHVAGERFARGLLTGPRPWPPGLLRKAEMSSRTPSERLLSAPAGTDVSPPHQKPPPLPLPALRPPQRRLQGEPPPPLRPRLLLPTPRTRGRRARPDGGRHRPMFSEKLGVLREAAWSPCPALCLGF